jgi:hypothetical protein
MPPLADFAKQTGCLFGGRSFELLLRTIERTGLGESQGKPEQHHESSIGCLY